MKLKLLHFYDGSNRKEYSSLKKYFGHVEKDSSVQAALVPSRLMPHFLPSPELSRILKLSFSFHKDVRREELKNEQYDNNFDGGQKLLPALIVSPHQRKDRNQQAHKSGKKVKRLRISLTDPDASLMKRATGIHPVCVRSSEEIQGNTGRNPLKVHVRFCYLLYPLNFQTAEC